VLIASIDVDRGADVETADAGMAVVGRLRPVITDDFLETAHELGQLLGRHRRILDVGDGLEVAAHGHEQAQTGLTHAPPVALLRLIGGRHRGVAEPLAGEVGLQLLQFRDGLVLGIAVELDEQDGAGVALHKLGELAEAGAEAAALDNGVVDQLDRRGRMIQSRDCGLRRLDDAAEVHRGDGLDLGYGHQSDLRLGDHAQGALGADDHARDVHRAQIVGEIVEVVAGDAAQDLGITLRDFVTVRQADAAQAAVDFALEVFLRQFGIERVAIDPFEAG
jgi:hypothetical protein